MVTKATPAKKRTTTAAKAKAPTKAKVKAKASTKAKGPKKVDYYPNRMTVAISALAGTLLVLITIIAVLGSRG